MLALRLPNNQFYPFFVSMWIISLFLGNVYDTNGGSQVHQQVPLKHPCMSQKIASSNVEYKLPLVQSLITQCGRGISRIILDSC